MGRVPGTVRYFDKVHEWVRALNDWASRQVKEFEQDPYSGKNTKTRKGFGLMDYCVPGGNESRTVVHNNFLDNGNGKHVDVRVQTYLRDGQISQVLSGHQPHGDCPLVIRTGSLSVITADTSYSNFGHGDNRGQAVSEVLITEGSHRSSHVHGKLADGTAIKYTVTDGEVCPGKEQGDQFVGKQLSDGRWVKAKTHNPAQKPGLDIASEEYVLCYGEGTKLTHSRMSAHTLAEFMELDKTSGFKSPADDEVATPPEVRKGDERPREIKKQTEKYFQQAYLLKLEDQDQDQPSSSSPTQSDRRSGSSSFKNDQKSGNEEFGMKWVAVGTEVPQSLKQITCKELAEQLSNKATAVNQGEANQDVIVFNLAHDTKLVGILKGNFSHSPLRQNHCIKADNNLYGMCC
jgi:hypothetical protein